MRSTLTISALVAVSIACPTKLSQTTTISPSTSSTVASNKLTASDILAIAPSANTCANAQFASECRTADEAAPYIAAGFDNFDITDFPSQAALLSLMLYESGSFKYNINHFPGVPGQGTRNMQSPAFNLQYAQWLATTVTNSNITADQVAQANTAGPAAVLALVDIDPWSFSSAAWFLSTQCSDAVKQELAKGTDNGWNGYLTDCVGTTATDDRTAIWKKAMALGKW